MEEINSNPEILSQTQDLKGNEIVAQARKAHPRGPTRRQFLQRLSAAALVGWALSSCVPIPEIEEPPKTALAATPIPESTPTSTPTLTPEFIPTPEPNPMLLTPEIVHDVEVYGLNEKIQSLEQVNNLYLYFDRQFEEKLPESVKQKDRFEQRDYLLNPNERYLEVVVRQSTYQSFLDRKAETGVDFAEWIKMHNDVLNRCMENAKPPSNLKVRLLRIVVVDDNFETNPSKYSKDIDATWFISKDYRVDQRKETIQGYFWSFYHDRDGNLIFRWPPGGDKIERTYKYPPKNDSLAGKDGVWLDIGIPHELSNYALNLIDEYLFKVYSVPPLFRFKKFIYETGAFHEPWISPYLAYLLIRNQEKEIRGFYTDPKSFALANVKEFPFGEIPNKVGLIIRVNGEEFNGRISVHTVRLPFLTHITPPLYCYYPPDYFKQYPRKDKTFSLEPDQESDKGNFDLDSNLFTLQKIKEDGTLAPPSNWILRIENSSLRRELHLPAAAFNMSKIAGKDQAHYEINFTGYDDPSKKTQILQLVDESDLDGYLEDCKKRDDKPYAQMKVDGTNTWFVWFLRD